MSSFFFAIIVVLVLVAGLSFLEFILTGKDHSISRSFSSTGYQRRAFIFDVPIEFRFFKELLARFGDRYHIFPEMGYARMIDVKVMPKYERRALRRRIDSRFADFVICDKEHAAPILVIELDGNSHGRPDRRERDTKIDAIAESVGLPILHIKNYELNDLNQVFAKIESELHKLRS